MGSSDACFNSLFQISPTAISLTYLKFNSINFLNINTRLLKISVSHKQIYIYKKKTSERGMSMSKLQKPNRIHKSLSIKCINISNPYVYKYLLVHLELNIPNQRLYIFSYNQVFACALYYYFVYFIAIGIYEVGKKLHKKIRHDFTFYIYIKELYSNGKEKNQRAIAYLLENVSFPNENENFQRNQKRKR